MGPLQVQYTVYTGIEGLPQGCILPALLMCRTPVIGAC
jgi:hypothetical protein